MGDGELAEGGLCRSISVSQHFRIFSYVLGFGLWTLGFIRRKCEIRNLKWGMRDAGPRRSTVILAAVLGYLPPVTAELRSPSHPFDEVGHGDAEAYEAEEGGGRGAGSDDPEGGQEGERLGGEGFAGGDDERAHGVPDGEPSGEAMGAGGVEDRGEKHPELRDHGHDARDVAVEPGDRQDREPDGESGHEERAHGDGEEEHGGAHGDLPPEEDRDDQNEADQEIEEDHVEPGHEDRFAGEVDFGEHRAGAVQGVRRGHDGIHKNLPEEGAHHGECRERDPGAGDVRDPLGLQKDERERGDERRQERPDIAEIRLPVLGAQIPDEQPPGEFAPGPDVGRDRPQHRPRVLEKRLGPVDVDGKVGGSGGLRVASGG